MDTTEFFTRMDWQALQQQKEYLLQLTEQGQDCHEIWGIISLIDNLQDSAIVSGFTTEAEAFNLN